MVAANRHAVTASRNMPSRKHCRHSNGNCIAFAHIVLYNDLNVVCRCVVKRDIRNYSINEIRAFCPRNKLYRIGILACTIRLPLVAQLAKVFLHTIGDNFSVISSCLDTQPNTTGIYSSVRIASGADNLVLVAVWNYPRYAIVNNRNRFCLICVIASGICYSA